MLKLVLLSILMVHYGSAHTYHTGECPAVAPMPEFDMKRVRIIKPHHLFFCLFLNCSWHLNKHRSVFSSSSNYCVNIIYVAVVFFFKLLLVGSNFISWRIIVDLGTWVAKCDGIEVEKRKIQEHHNMAMTLFCHFALLWFWTICIPEQQEMKEKRDSDHHSQFWYQLEEEENGNLCIPLFICFFLSFFLSNVPNVH